jgi:tripartite-type tricarboxylate transporter receptor subunit TctC
MAEGRARQQHQILQLTVRGRLAIAAAALLIAGSAAAQESYPSKPIKLYVGFTAGGGTDYVARVIADKMFEGAGRSAVVENRPGASGIIAADATVRAAPDGYSLMFAPTGVITVNPATHANLSYAPQRDFIAVAQAVTFPCILAVNKALPVASVSDLVAWAKANPAQANQGGSGAAFQLIAKLFQKHTGASFEYIQYKSTGESTAALITGEIAMSLVDSGPLSGAIKNNQVRGLAVSSAKRLSAFPDLPTLTEAGMPGFEVELWMGLFAPAGTPDLIVRKLEAEIIRIVKLPDVQEKLRAHEVEPAGIEGARFARMIAAETERYAAIAREFNIRVGQ